ncbi:MAG: hypothetical protein AB3N11_16560 [Arenibacterium sp.]
MTKQGLATGTAIAALFVYLSGPTLAQDEGGLRVSLGVSQTFGTGDNLALGVPGSATNPEQGTTSQSLTSFALNVDSITRNQRFNLQTGGALRFASLPAGSSTDTGFVDPFLSLSYEREAANARFSFDGSFEESDISQGRPLWDFTDEDNIITPPADLSSLQGTGLRLASDVAVDLEIGLNSPIGFRFFANNTSVSYDDETAPDLNDFDRTSVGASTFFRFNPVTTAVVDYSFTRFNETGVANDRDTETIEVGFDREFADQSQLSFRIGYTDGDANNVGRPDNASGLSGSLNYSRPLTDGSLSARYAVTRDSTGEIDRLNFDRNFVLRGGSLGVSVGATSVYGSSPRFTGGINWSQQFQTSELSLQLNRQVLPDENDDSRFTTSFAAQYTHTLSPYSAFVANFSYFVSDGSATTNEVDRGDVVLRYDYTLTDDWNLNAGINLSMRDEETVGRGESQEIFVGLSRRFDLY